MEISATSSEEYNLNKLAQYLNYELSSSFLVLMWYWWSMTLILAIGAAMIFIPFMLYIFYEEGKWAWFLSFCFTVVMPTAGLLLLSWDSSYLMGIMLIPFGLFYVYCVVLRYLVNGRLNVLRAKRNFDAEASRKKMLLNNAKEKLGG